MDKFAIITGSLGAIFGGYGAWRAWRTDRTLKLLGNKWEIEPHDRNMYLLRNKQPRTVYGVTASGPEGHIIELLGDEDDDGLKPNEAMQTLVLITYIHKVGPIDVTWHHRPDCSDAPKLWSGHLPAEPLSGS